MKVKKQEKDIRQFIVLRPEGFNELVDIDLRDFNHDVYRALDIECYEHVHIGSVNGVDLHMLVDEIGAFSNSRLNPEATYLYGRYIFGSVLLCTTLPLRNGEVIFAPFEGSEFYKMCSIFLRR